VRREQSKGVFSRLRTVLHKAKLRRLIVAACVALVVGGPSAARSSMPIEGFADVNGVRIQYLDWGGSGPELVLVPGLEDNPHIFDDLAPALTKKRHVIAYARRGSGNSDTKGPYDLATLTEDLRELMNALAIPKADLVGYSAGGAEITEMAARYPERVSRLIYFDSAYDYKDPVPPSSLSSYFNPPDAALRSLASFLDYYKSTYYSALSDIGPLEANLRQKVVIQLDGSVKFRFPMALIDELKGEWQRNNLQYGLVKCPVLALYAQHTSDPSNDEKGAALAAYERNQWLPWQWRSIDYIRRQIPKVQIARLPGGHGDFIIVSHQQVVDLMTQFFGAS